VSSPKQSSGAWFLASHSHRDFEKVNARLGPGLEFRLQPVCIFQLRARNGPRERGTPNDTGLCECGTPNGTIRGV